MQSANFASKRDDASQDLAANASGRFDFIDAARGLCILFVVMMHSTLGAGEHMNARGVMHDVVDFAKPFRIPAFFMIAGLLAPKPLSKGLANVLDKKVFYFFYFYVLWAGIQIFLKDYVSCGFDARSGLRAFALALIDPYGALWFIYILPFFFLASYAALRTYPYFFLLGAATLHMAQIETGWMAIDSFADKYVYFLFGCLFSAQLQNFGAITARRRLTALAALAVWFLFNAAGTIAASPEGPGNPLIPAPFSLLYGLAGALALIAICALLASVGLAGALAELGKRTLTIYLAFFFPMAAMRFAATEKLPLGSVDLAALLVTATALLTPLIIKKLADRFRLRFLFARPRIFSLERFHAAKCESRELSRNPNRMA